jgi:D-alanyl-D-alanine carboxypeptidase
MLGQISQRRIAKSPEEAGFDVLLSTDKNIWYQQNLTGRRIAIVILGNPQRPAVHKHMDRVIEAVNATTQGSYAEAEIPYE